MKAKNILHLQLYLFFHIYDNLNIPSLAVVIVFANTYKVLNYSHKYYTSGIHI